VKAGDLVELSVYGRSIKTVMSFKDDLGIVLSDNDDNLEWVSVKWIRRGVRYEHPRKDLRKAKIRDEKSNT
tara:strand:- start:393 stop:605 length:213 start_codon:yes stop_codon:yes gene_type:complete